METNRRRFLETAAVGTLALSKGVHAAGDNRKLRIGVIGVGWYGMVTAKAALQVGNVEVKAICDVDSQHLTQSADELEQLQQSRPQTYKRYEDLLSEDLDVAIIGTPPQWHALQLITALERGLDVYCEKPISYDVREGQAMVDAVASHNRIVQIGFQRRQSQALHQAMDFIGSGQAGDIVQVDAQIHYLASTKDPTPQDPPESLDWNLWCGPGPMIPYSPQVGHLNWRLERTSGHGHLVDWGIHLIDATRMMLGLSMPKRITAVGGLYHYAGQITTPDTLTVHFEFDRCPLVWRHRIWGAAEYRPEVSNGIFFYGDKATVFATDRRWEVIPTAKHGQRKEYTVDADMQNNHMADFLHAVRFRKQPSCPIKEGFKSTATVHLAMISYETNSTIAWEEDSLRISGDTSGAAQLLTRPYREPWIHPYTA